MENSRINPTTLRPMIVDDASLTVVKNTSPQRVLELSVPILLNDEEILRETKTPYPNGI